MKLRDIVFSFFHFLVVFLFLAVGGILMAIPLSKKVHFVIVQTLLEEPMFFFFLGVSVVSFSVLLFSLLYWLNKKRYFHLELEHCEALVNEGIIKDYVTEYWKQMFPGQKPKLQVVIHPSELIEVITTLPTNLEEMQSLNKIEKELTTLFSKKFGYKKKLTLTVVDS